MNAINVIPKVVETAPARTVEMRSVKWQTLDDAFNKRLRVAVNGSVVLVIEGADYDALGQWTDETMKAFVFGRLGLVEQV